MNELHLFAGAGGGILASELLGHRCVCAVEFDPYAQAVLVARQNDGTFPPFPIWDDVRTFDGRPWRGIVDLVAGGFPCQDISTAGRGDGLDGERSGLWSEMARIIGEVRPRYVLVENSPALTSRGLERVLGDLAALGFDAEWGVLGADDCGAPHQRERIWLVAHANGVRELQPQGREQDQRGWPCNCGEEVADAPSLGQPGPGKHVDACHCAADRQGQASDVVHVGFRKQWPPEPGLGRVVDGMAHRSHRLKAIGNGQVSRVAAAAWRILR